MTQNATQETPPTADELFGELHGDVEAALRRAQKAKALETKHELASNVYPLILKLVAACRVQNAEVLELDDELTELIEGEGSVIQPTLAAGILGLLDLGVEMSKALRHVGAHEPSAMTICDTFDSAVQAVAADVQLATVAAGEAPEDDEVDADDDEEEGDDGAEEADVEQAADGQEK